MGSKKTPRVPDPANTYRKGIETDLQFAPQIADAERAMRAQYDNSDVAAKLGAQQDFGSAFVSLYKGQIDKANPFGTDLGKQVGQDVMDDLAKGYHLDDYATRDVQQATRARQAASGNIFGNAAASAEGVAIEGAAVEARTQRLTNAGTFLAADGAVRELAQAQLLTTGATTPDRTDEYVDPFAGSQLGNLSAQAQQQAEQMAQYYSSHIQDFLSPGQRLLQGAYIGAREGWSGGSLFGPVVGAFGAIGGALGGSFQGYINAPDYQFNVQNSGYAIYGVPWQSTAISLGTLVASSAAGAGSGIGASIASASVSAAGNYWSDYYKNGGG